MTEKRGFMKFFSSNGIHRYDKLLLTNHRIEDQSIVERGVDDRKFVIMAGTTERFEMT